MRRRRSVGPLVASVMVKATWDRLADGPPLTGVNTAVMVALHGTVARAGLRGALVVYERRSAMWTW